MSGDVQPRSSPPEDLYGALWDILRRPVKTLVPPWSWKAALLSGLLRAGTFFTSNLKSGPREAVRAMLIEAVYAVLTAGLIGAISQRLRAANPVWATAAVVCLGLPGVMILAQFALHQLAHTPHASTGIMVSFASSAFAAAFSWYAMRHGSMLGGADSTTVREDFARMPRITLDFVSAIPRSIWKRIRPGGAT